MRQNTLRTQGVGVQGRVRQSPDREALTQMLQEKWDLHTWKQGEESAGNMGGL
jgi:hypothetical protein